MVKLANTLLPSSRANTIILSYSQLESYNFLLRLTPYCFIPCHCHPTATHSPARILLLFTVVFWRTWVIPLATYTLWPGLNVLTPLVEFICSVQLEICITPSAHTIIPHVIDIMRQLFWWVSWLISDSSVWFSLLDIGSCWLSRCIS